MRMPEIELARIKSQNVRNVASLTYVHKKCGVRQSIKMISAQYSSNNDKNLVTKLVIVLTKSAPASILSYLLHEEVREIFAKIYLV